MSDGDEAAASSVLRCFLDALHAGDAVALTTVLQPDATFFLEADGVLIDLSRAQWVAHVATRCGSVPAERNTLSLRFEPPIATFKVDTRLPARTFTDRVLMRRDGQRWRVSSLSSY